MVVSSNKIPRDCDKYKVDKPSLKTVLINFVKNEVKYIMRLVCYPLLATKSRRAFMRTKTSWGNTYNYRPRGDLLERLSKKLNWTKEQVLDQLVQERSHLLKIRGLI